MPVPASAIRTLAKGINLSHWLSQHSLDEPHLQSYIGEKDFALIARLGFTHVRLPIDNALLQSPDGALRPQGFTYVGRALEWARTYRLGVVLDLHPVPAPKIAQDATAYARFEKLWQAIAQRYARRPLNAVPRAVVLRRVRGLPRLFAPGFSLSLAGRCGEDTTKAPHRLGDMGLQRRLRATWQRQTRAESG